MACKLQRRPNQPDGVDRGAGVDLHRRARKDRQPRRDHTDESDLGYISGDEGGETADRTCDCRHLFPAGYRTHPAGFHHLLFVLALLLLIRDLRSLLLTITAFTAAHSITLAFSALGIASAPQPPVEALIALSIMFVASEIVRSSCGNLSSRYPWLVSFLFGLLHGFGFGGALREIGLPQKDVPLACSPLIWASRRVSSSSLALRFCWLDALGCVPSTTFRARGFCWPISSGPSRLSGLSSASQVSRDRNRVKIRSGWHFHGSYIGGASRT